MKKVKMLVDTAYKGPRKAGETVDVPDDFAIRWAKNGIATILEDTKDDQVDDEKASEEEQEVIDDGQEDESQDDGQVGDVDYESMSAKDLYALCKEKGIEAKSKQPKQYYIDLLA